MKASNYNDNSILPVKFHTANTFGKKICQAGGVAPTPPLLH